MDNILVFSKNERDHKKHVGQILQKLREHKLSLKPEKCWFSKKEIEFLGLIISDMLREIGQKPPKTPKLRVIMHDNA